MYSSFEQNLLKGALENIVESDKIKWGWNNSSLRFIGSWVEIVVIELPLLQNVHNLWWVLSYSKNVLQCNK